MLNSQLDYAQLATRYQEDHRVRIEGLLDADIAQRIGAILSQSLEYELAYVAGNQNMSMSMDQLAATTPEQRRDLFQYLYAEAAEGRGFLYGRFHLSEAGRHEGEVAFLHEFYEFLNSAEMFDAIRTITGIDDVRSADGQATSYRPGHFLTRHRDDLSGQERRLAYVLGFTSRWHPDWGGLLQFFEEDGTPRDAWVPQFNTLSLFDVKHIHSVTHVAPYAAQPRLSITGWFRASPPAAAD